MTTALLPSMLWLGPQNLNFNRLPSMSPDRSVIHVPGLDLSPGVPARSGSALPPSEKLRRASVVPVAHFAALISVTSKARQPANAQTAAWSARSQPPQSRQTQACRDCHGSPPQPAAVGSLSRRRVDASRAEPVFG
jgi:hypothetical protein